MTKQRTIYPKLYWLSPPAKPVIARLGRHLGRRWAVRLPWLAHEALPPAPERFAGLHVFERYEDARAWTAEQIDARLDEDSLAAFMKRVAEWWKNFEEAERLFQPSSVQRSLHYDRVHWGFDRVGTDG